MFFLFRIFWKWITLELFLLMYICNCITYYANNLKVVDGFQKSVKSIRYCLLITTQWQYVPVFTLQCLLFMSSNESIMNRDKGLLYFTTNLISKYSAYSCSDKVSNCIHFISIALHPSYQWLHCHVNYRSL